MAIDYKTEQIGLAVSSDGVNFKRVKSNGLIIPTDPFVPWRDLRVCNPEVLRVKNGFLMFFQGISTNKLHTSIGKAFSTNGLDWAIDDSPLLTINHMTYIDRFMDPGKRVDLIEPSVIKEGSVYRIWFNYRHPSHPGNSFFLAEGNDGGDWQVIADPVLSGRLFYQCSIYYPHVQKYNDAYIMHFTIRNNINGVDGIFRMESADGRNWVNLRQILPQSDHGFCLKHREYLSLTICGKRFDKISTEWNRKVLLRYQNGRNFLGYSHPCLPEGPFGKSIYYHNDNYDHHGRWMDIGRCQLSGDNAFQHEIVLQRSPNRHAWDSVFVADPFLLIC